jgi:hypothetical protein
MTGKMRVALEQKGEEIPHTFHVTCGRCEAQWDVAITLVADGRGVATAKGPIVVQCPNGCGPDD